MKYFLSFCLLFCSIGLWCQDELRYEDYTYLDHIRSVKFHHSRLVTSEPILDLGSRGQLILSFDDILGGDRDYSYRVIHCDKDWNPSDITEMDYLEGFNDEEINDYTYSAGTKYDYTHYRLAFPNDETNVRISGNYLLIITDEDSDELALTRRFMVSERKVSVGAELIRSRKLGRMLYDQEIELFIDNKNYPIANPQNEIYVTVLQNGRWDNSISNIQPKVALGNQIRFDLTSQITFPAYNEFRGADLRTLRSRGFGVYAIDIFEDEINVILELDTKRGNVLFQNYEDINGDFIVETLEYRNAPNRAEYVNVQFTLAADYPVLDGEVYVVGAFNNWRPQEEWRLQYDKANKVYTGVGLLKQGYYDYQYLVQYDNGVRDLEYFEGCHYATKNQYHILVYQRTFGSRFDQLISVSSFDSVLGY